MASLLLPAVSNRFLLIFPTFLATSYQASSLLMAGSPGSLEVTQSFCISPSLLGSGGIGQLPLVGKGDTTCVVLQISTVA